jgi:hypothetical protein
MALLRISLIVISTVARSAHAGQCETLGATCTACLHTSGCEWCQLDGVVSHFFVSLSLRFPPAPFIWLQPWGHPRSNDTRRACVSAQSRARTRASLSTSERLSTAKTRCSPARTSARASLARSRDQCAARSARTPNASAGPGFSRRAKPTTPPSASGSRKSSRRTWWPPRSWGGASTLPRTRTSAPAA